MIRPISPVVSCASSASMSKPRRSLSSRLAEASFRGSIWGSLWAVLFGKVEMMDFYRSRSATTTEFQSLKEYCRNLPIRLSYVPRGSANGAAFFSIWYSTVHLGSSTVGVDNESTQIVAFGALGYVVYLFHHDNPYLGGKQSPPSSSPAPIQKKKRMKGVVSRPLATTFFPSSHFTSSLKFLLSRGRIK